MAGPLDSEDEVDFATWDDADEVDEYDEHLHRRRTTGLSVRSRADSWDSSLGDNVPRTSRSPSVSLDEPILDAEGNVFMTIDEDQPREYETSNPGLHQPLATIDSLDFEDIDAWSSPFLPPSQTPSIAESESDDDMRFEQPDRYFAKLDDLGSQVYDRSTFHFYIDGTTYTPPTMESPFRMDFIEGSSSQRCSTADIKEFVSDVFRQANNKRTRIVRSSHNTMLSPVHPQIELLGHLIECRNAILKTWESIQQMRAEGYCGNFFSALVLDQTRHSVVKLMPIEYHKVEKLALDFEDCVFKLLSFSPADVLYRVIHDITKNLSKSCEVFLQDFLPDVLWGWNPETLWRCAVHFLDLAALSYVGAHTQLLGRGDISSITIPGPFLEAQHFRFRRRTFSCLNEFFGGREVWVFEPGRFRLDADSLPSSSALFLLTDAITFADIWGPMWKSCINGDEDQIIQYNVGNGVIVPWNQASSTSQDAIEVQDGEVFCHWMSETDSPGQGNLNMSRLPVHAKDLMLIGAPDKLDTNGACKASIAVRRQQLRRSGCLSEPGTVKSGKFLESETFLMQVTAPYVTFGKQLEYKKRGTNMKKALIEKWRSSSSNRQVRHLEFKLGVEISTCTSNARRITLIELFGTKTMVNHLRACSLQWTSAECKDAFYRAIQDPDHTAFRKLYESQPTWQPGLGNAIDSCFDVLAETGKSGKDLAAFWAPDNEPGEIATFKSNELTWIGFLEDTETSGALVVLEDKCLELQIFDLGKQCQSTQNHTKNSIGRFSENVLRRSILQTSVQLNEDCVPESIKNGLRNFEETDGIAPRYRRRWSLKELRVADRFEFGKKGCLAPIRILYPGQILAAWTGSLPSPRQIINAVSGSGSAMKRCHYECIRDRKEDVKPVSFIILSNADISLLRSVRISRRLPVPQTSADTDEQVGKNNAERDCQDEHMQDNDEGLTL